MPNNQEPPADLDALAGRLEKGAAGLEGMLSSSCVAPDLREAARCVRLHGVMLEAVQLTGVMFRHPVGVNADYGSLRMADSRAREAVNIALAAVEGAEVGE